MKIIKNAKALAGGLLAGAQLLLPLCWVFLSPETGSGKSMRSRHGESDCKQVNRQESTIHCLTQCADRLVFGSLPLILRMLKLLAMGASGLFAAIMSIIMVTRQ